ncbi:MAG: hypothetical protein KDA88_06720 [Planctomycetaceae bacterium]|nr:hypothetical protein [Planctomycetaceae bacterium]MCB9953140.1 hypothetical protein [Planctomycetaceae bacterium]
MSKSTHLLIAALMSLLAIPGYGQDTRDSAALGVLQKLKIPVHLEFTETPLKDILKSISEQAGVEIVADEADLADEGVTPETPVSIEVDGIHARAALSLVLRPLEFDWWVAGGKVIVLPYDDTHHRMRGPYSTKVYEIADLIGVGKDGDEYEISNRGEKFVSRLMELNGLPNWEVAGGVGKANFHPESQSVVVYQHELGHKEISQLLSQIRQIVTRRIRVDMEVLEFDGTPECTLQINGTLVDAEMVESLRELADLSRFGRASALPSVTILNGRTTTLKRGFDTLISALAVDGEDRIKLTVQSNQQHGWFGDFALTQSNLVPADATMAFVLSGPDPNFKDNGTTTVLLLTPHVEIAE